jgi:hypothetical protein
MHPIQARRFQTNIAAVIASASAEAYLVPYFNKQFDPKFRGTLDVYFDQPLPVSQQDVADYFTSFKVEFYPNNISGDQTEKASHLTNGRFDVTNRIYGDLPGILIDSAHVYHLPHADEVAAFVEKKLFDEDLIVNIHNLILDTQYEFGHEDWHFHGNDGLDLPNMDELDVVAEVLIKLAGKFQNLH